MLERRPASEQWAVIVNDFGAIRIPARVDRKANRGLSVREVAGCICCTSQVALRTGLVTALRDARPQRLVIEASAAASPKALLQLLSETGIASALDVQMTVCVVDPNQVRDSRYAALDVYCEQIAAADCLLISKSDATDETLRNAARSLIMKIKALNAVLTDSTEDVIDRLLGHSW